MAIRKPSFAMGIEEGYLLVVCKIRNLAAKSPAEFLAKCEARLDHRVTAEFMRSQIEVGTRVCTRIGEAHGELQELRGTVAEVAGRYSLAPIAATTHPFTHWRKQSHTDKKRYPTLEIRMTDIGTSRENTLTVAALYQSILAMLYRLRTSNKRWRFYPLICVQENRWRAQRYGITDSLVDFGLGNLVPYGELLAEVMNLVARDAEALGCADKIRHAREILTKGNLAQIRYRSMTQPSRAAPIRRMP